MPLFLNPALQSRFGQQVVPARCVSEQPVPNLDLSATDKVQFGRRIEQSQREKIESVLSSMSGTLNAQIHNPENGSASLETMSEIAKDKFGELGHLLADAGLDGDLDALNTGIQGAVRLLHEIDEQRYSPTALLQIFLKSRLWGLTHMTEQMAQVEIDNQNAEAVSQRGQHVSANRHRQPALGERDYAARDPFDVVPTHIANACLNRRNPRKALANVFLEKMSRNLEIGFNAEENDLVSLCVLSAQARLQGSVNRFKPELADIHKGLVKLFRIYLTGTAAANATPSSGTNASRAGLIGEMLGMTDITHWLLGENAETLESEACSAAQAQMEEERGNAEARRVAQERAEEARRLAEAPRAVDAKAGSVRAIVDNELAGLNEVQRYERFKGFWKKQPDNTYQYPAEVRLEAIRQVEFLLNPAHQYDVLEMASEDADNEVYRAAIAMIEMLGLRQGWAGH